MTSEKGFSMDDLMRGGFWEANRNRIIGLVVVSALVVLGVLLFQQQGDSKEAAGWENLLDGGRFVADVEINDAIRGTAAEPWAMLMHARSHAADEEYAEARDVLQDLQAQFPDHPMHATVVPELLEHVNAELAWFEANPKTENNPEVADDKCLTLKTPVGDIKIGLYPDQAPEATAALLGMIADGSMAGSAFNEAQEGVHVIWNQVDEEEPGEDEDGSEEEESEEEGSDDEEDEEEEREASPLARGVVGDRNYLSHFEGSVSFQRPFGTVEPDAKPRVVIYLSESPYRDSNEVVFGRVMAGLDLLKQIAERDPIEGEALLEEPVSVDSIEVGAGLK